MDSSSRRLPNTDTPADVNAASSGRKKPHDDAEQTGAPAAFSVTLRVVMFVGLMGILGSRLIVLFSCKLSTWTYSASITDFEVIDQLYPPFHSSVTGLRYFGSMMRPVAPPFRVADGGGMVGSGSLP